MSSSESVKFEFDTFRYFPATGKFENLQSGAFMRCSVSLKLEPDAVSSLSALRFNILGFEITVLKVLFNVFFFFDFELFSEDVP